MSSDTSTESQNPAAGVFLTGASGFIGSSFLDRLVAEGHLVRVLAFPGTEASLQGRDGIDVVRCDLAQPDPRTLQQALRGVATVFHLAGIKDENDPRLWKMNVDGTRVLLESCARSESVRRFVFSSSIAVYPRAVQMWPRSWPIRETAALRDATAAYRYGGSKVAAEQMLREAAESGGFEYAVLRSTICYSADSEAFQWLVSQVADNKLSSGTFRQGVNQSVHLDDMVEALIQAGFNPTAANEVFNIAGNEPGTIDDIAVCVREVRSGDALTGVRDTPVGVPPGKLKYDISKAQRLLGFSPCRSFRDEVPKVMALMAKDGLPGLAGYSPLRHSGLRHAMESGQLGPMLGAAGGAGPGAGGPGGASAPPQPGALLRALAGRAGGARLPGVHAPVVTPPATRPVKVGLMIPILENPGGGTGWKDLVAKARLAEQVGFDSLWLADHLMFRHSGQLHQNWQMGSWDCWSILSALAAETKRVELGTLVVCTSFRNPALLAKMADTVDEISAGRLILGLGAGYHEAEFRAFGYPHDHLVGRFEEAVTVISKLLRERTLDFEGQYYSARECELRPSGPRRSGPPILIGAKGKRMLRLTAQFADQWNGWFVYDGGTAEDVVARRLAVDRACEAAGRDPATLARTLAVRAAPGSSGAVGPIARAGQAEPSLCGSPQEIVDGLMSFQRQGISHVQIVMTPLNMADIESFGRALEYLDRHVVA